MFDGLIEFIKNIISLVVSPIEIAVRALGMIGSGADIFIYGSTQNLFPTIITYSFAFSLVAGFIKFVWHY